MEVFVPNYESILKKLAVEEHTWLITGVAGFIGSNLLEALLKSNQQVVGLDNYSTGFQHNLEEVRSTVSADQWKKFRFIEGDIRNIDDCLKACDGVDYVFHEAALGSVPRSILDPITTNAVNISGFLNILIAARDSGVKRIVYAASSSTYGDHTGLPKIEGTIGNPLSPYAVTKLANELYANVFAKSYQMELIGLRYFNVFGPRQDPYGAYAAVIPAWLVGMLEKRPIYINGDGSTTRDFCFITNVVQANFLAAMSKSTEAINQVFNVAVGEQSSLLELFKILKNELRLYSHEYNFDPIFKDFREGDIRNSLASIDKAKKILGYLPTCNLKDGVSLYLKAKLKTT
jgi:UDP-N-acetylglucosamine 4-epimerase